VTAQIPDRFFYDGEEYRLTGLKGGNLFEPKEHGLRPLMRHFGCHRGYYCDYEIRDGVLMLTHLVINHMPDANTEPEDVQYPLLMGIAAQIEPDREITEEEAEQIPYLRGRVVGKYYQGEKQGFEVCYNGAVYADLRLPIRLTGGILLGSELLENEFWYMGRRQPEVFEKLIEVLFDDGRVTQIIDRSAHVAERREQLRANPELRTRKQGDKDATDNEFVWRFSLDYNL
jgi:hypothetical protein